MTLPQYDTTAYSDANNFRYFSYNCISHLLENNEGIWKLLHYNDADAWKKPNLTMQEKRSLIYAGQPDETLFRVFISEKQPDAWVHEACVLRIFPFGITPDNRTVNTTIMVFDVYSHYRIDTLSNYTTRVDTIVEELIKVFNGSNIGGLGRLFFNSSAVKNTGARDSGQIPFGGKRIIMATKMG